MAQHHLEHAGLCPAKHTRKRADCTCDATVRDSKRITLGDAVGQVDELVATPKSSRRERRANSIAGITMQREIARAGATVDVIVEPELTVEQMQAIAARMEAMAWGGTVLAEPQASEPVLTEEQMRAIVARMEEAAMGPNRPDENYLVRIGSLISDSAHSLVSLRRTGPYADSPKDRAIEIMQVCPACREAYRSTTSDQATELEAYAKVGAEARRARLTHRCPDIVGQLGVLSFDDLQKLGEELERRGSATLERGEEVRRYADARRAREVES